MENISSHLFSRPTPVSTRSKLQPNLVWGICFTEISLKVTMSSSFDWVVTKIVMNGNQMVLCCFLALTGFLALWATEMGFLQTWQSCCYTVHWNKKECKRWINSFDHCYINARYNENSSKSAHFLYIVWKRSHDDLSIMHLKEWLLTTFSYILISSSFKLLGTFRETTFKRAVLRCLPFSINLNFHCNLYAWYNFTGFTCFHWYYSWTALLLAVT